MKLATLMKGTTIQGDIRLSVWNEDGEEIEVKYLNCVDNLACEPSAKNWKKRTCLTSLLLAMAFCTLNLQNN